MSQLDDNNASDIDNKAKFEQFMHDLLMDKDSNGDAPPNEKDQPKNANLAQVKDGSDNSRPKYNYPLIIATGNASGQNNTSP